MIFPPRNAKLLFKGGQIPTLLQKKARNDLLCNRLQKALVIFRVSDNRQSDKCRSGVVKE
jgi:hypothetical protein